MSKRKSVIIMLIVFLAIGFATVSTTLVLNGILAIGENKDDFDIIFTKTKLNGVNKNNFISEDKKHINFISNELKTLEDKAILTYEVTNTSRNYDANVSVTCTAGTTELITFEYTPHEMEILAGETKSGTFTASMFKLVDEATEVPIECILTATAKTREDLGEEYIAPFSKSGVMMSAPSSSEPDQKFWSYNSNITKIIFEDELSPHETDDNFTFDVSDRQDKSVMAYLVPNGETLTVSKDSNNKDLENTTAYTLYIQGDTGVIAESGFGLFSHFNNLITIDNLRYLDISEVTTIFYMFGYCENLASLDLSSFNTSKVTNMSFLFNSCYNLTSIVISSFDTTNVTDMSGMFTSCKKLNYIELSNFDTSNVTNMREMFHNCNNLEILNINNFNTNNVTNMSYMFSGCRSLTSLNLSNFNTSKVTNMMQMFTNCSNLKKLDLKSFNTSNVTRMWYMFYGCKFLEAIDLSNFDTSKVTDMGDMFHGCISLTSLDLSNFDTSNVTNMSRMFYNCEILTHLDISNFNFQNLQTEASKSYIFFLINNSTTVCVKDEVAQNWILGLSTTDRPSTWTTENVIIKEAA